MSEPLVPEPALTTTIDPSDPSTIPIKPIGGEIDDIPPTTPVMNASEEQDIKDGMQAMIEEENTQAQVQGNQQADITKGQFTTKHYIVFSMTVFVCASAFLVLKRYKHQFLQDRVGVKLNPKDVELTSDEEMNPFLGRIDGSGSRSGAPPYLETYSDAGREF